MPEPVAWSLVVIWLGGIVHVLAARNGGSWRSPPDARCPMPPRVGWLVLVVALGPLGWFMFLRGRRAAMESRSRPPSAS